METAKIIAQQLLPYLESLIQDMIDTYDQEEFESKAELLKFLASSQPNIILVTLAVNQIKAQKELAKKESVSS